MITAPVKKSSKHWQAFFLATVIAAIIFVPFMIMDNGFFFYYGDYNVQQIPFYKLAHEAVRTGDIWWNWHTDLGANFIGSYSFYLLGSPFFWMTLPFPTEFVPYLLAPLLILKHACAALTSYFFLQRFVRNKSYAVIGSLLYAFSGWAMFNVFFNHFHEVMVFFPLLLIGLEELVVNDRRGVFAIAVAVNAFVNYWFFIGEVVFVLLYFVVRMTSPDWRMRFKTFLWVAFESVIGVLLACALLLPSVLAITGNPRTGVSEILTGWSMWTYEDGQRPLAILGSMFFPPDIPSRPNFFPDHGAKWASLSAWLPMLGMTGVIAYCSSIKRSWIKKLLSILLLCAMVRGLNSLFILLNYSYYARWFYMPILVMCLATVLSLENTEIDYGKGLRWTTGITLAFIAMIAFTPTELSPQLKFGLMKYPDRFWIYVIITLAGLLLTIMLVKYFREHAYFKSVLAFSLAGIIAIYSITMIAMGRQHSDDRGFIQNIALEGRYALEINDDEFARYDILDSMDNLGMFWHVPNIQAFHSIVPPSIMTFYPEVGVKRDVSSKPEPKYYALRSLLSVKWLFIAEDAEEQNPMPGYAIYSKQLGYNIYKNENFIPMGFAYDYYITEDELKDVPEEQRSQVMMRALVLPNEAAGRNDDVLAHLPEERYVMLTKDDFAVDAANRQSMCSYQFKTDNRGFTCNIDLLRENLVFFSVPNDKGWTAYVNGKPVQIEPAQVGFMAVRVPAGDTEIRFEYHTPGLMLGLYITAAAAIILLLYLLLYRAARKRHPLLPVIDADEETTAQFYAVHSQPSLIEPKEPAVPELPEELGISDVFAEDAEPEPPQDEIIDERTAEDE